MGATGCDDMSITHYDIGTRCSVVLVQGRGPFKERPREGGGGSGGGYPATRTVYEG